MKIITILIALLLLTTIFGLVPAEENNPILYVDDDGGADYTKIQDAINNASDGDIIFVLDGIYDENLIITKQIQLIGADKEKTIIAASNSLEYLILDTVNSTFIYNLTFSCSNTERTDIIKMINCLHCTISNINVFSDTIQRSAIIINGSQNNINQVTIKGRFIFSGIELFYTDYNSIMNNSIDSSGAGILIHRSHNNLIASNSLINNTNGIYIEEGNRNTITRNIIKRNNRGLFSSYSTYNIIENNNFIDNDENAKFTKLLKKGFLPPNTWRNNYWDDYKGYLIKPIFGLMYIPNRHLIGFFFPWFEFDFAPVKQPYNIDI